MHDPAPRKRGRTHRVRVLGLCLALAALLGACSAPIASTGDVAEPVPTLTPTPVTPSPSPTPEPTGTPSDEATDELEPEPTPSPSPSEQPSYAYDVAEAQRTLADLGYYAGPVDGEPGAAMRSAVMAFQKVNGLSADGIVGPKTHAALASPVTPTLRASSPPTRIEVDLSKQVLYYVRDGALTRIMPVSSGSGASYTHPSGARARSLTPVGWFRIERRIRGLREAPLGSLYDPLYFYRGWAIHGSNSVPAYPASHGCVRVTRADALWLFERAPVGTHVYLYGGTHTFTAGSAAPGTDDPAGDTAQPQPSPSPSPSPSPEPTPSPSPSPTPEPSPSPSPTPEPSPSPTPSPDPSPEPSPSPSPSPSGSPGTPQPSPTPTSSP